MSVAEKGSTAAAIWPVSVAVGVVSVLVGLIVNPLLFVPLGGAIAVLAAFLWARGNRISPGRGAGAQAPINGVKRLGDGEPASGPESLLYPLDPIS